MVGEEEEDEAEDEAVAAGVGAVAAEEGIEGGGWRLLRNLASLSYSLSQASTLAHSLCSLLSSILFRIEHGGLFAAGAPQDLKAATTGGSTRDIYHIISIASAASRPRSPSNTPPLLHARKEGERNSHAYDPTPLAPPPLEP